MVKFLLLDFLLLLFCTRVRCCEKEDDASAARESAFRGRYTRDDRITRNYEIVVPRKVMIDGRFISYQIPHHYKRSHYRNRRREKMTPDDIVHYRVAIDGQEHHLEMYPNHKLFGPGAVLETRNSETGQSAATGTEFLKDTKMRRLRDTECHYHGNVRDHDGNSALSTCYGLAGYIRTKRGLYMIEPLDGHDFTKDIEHPHIVYKRNDAVSEEDGRPLCNVTSKFEKQISRLDFPRQKRDSCNDSKSYTIELLVVLDKTLLTYHKDFDVENYVLTLFNMVGAILKVEGSVGSFFFFQNHHQLSFAHLSGIRIIRRFQFGCPDGISHSENHKTRSRSGPDEFIGEQRRRDHAEIFSRMAAKDESGRRYSSESSRLRGSPDKDRYLFDAVSVRFYGYVDHRRYLRSLERSRFGIGQRSKDWLQHRPSNRTHVSDDATKLSRNRPVIASDL
ncbi:A disintegrin and metalloproteinase with thrombospondin motifs 3-like isoform X1 [Athalia rosae]|uniref:A disintegrin and metalloproteinase with thrombospondin motifs 3-like isoform X1 n=1 Tax=Athalia rosae TaxID=37344 RepID=UPI0020335E98|nr:A disintegrin and metalloproteinase with thrombospondin motifs 3-like isoform X1 [Athalia rosae]XP_048507995.1 A disintegrin and metalloproteinase with thrombospondin motifs 3-like isoform X1 [Athalia rosae]